MGEKVTFNTDIKTIIIDQAPTFDGSDWVVDIDVKVDLFSDGKEDWLSNEPLSRFKYPILTAGGDALPGSKSLGVTYFLEYGWKIRPYEGDHVLKVNGNIYSRDGSSPFVPTSGSYNIMVINTVSNLVDSTLSQLQELEYSSYQNSVWINELTTNSGVDYPNGTREHPVNNAIDAVSIAQDKGFGELCVIGNYTFTSGDNIDNLTVIGQNPIKSYIVLEPSASTIDCEFRYAKITGTLDGGSWIVNCEIENLNYVEGHLLSCMLEAGVITLGGTTEATLINCYSGVIGEGTPIIDYGTGGRPLQIRNYNGGIKVINKNSSDAISMDINSGHVILDNTVNVINYGDIVLRGVGKITDNSTGEAIDISGFLSTENIAQGIYDKTVDPETTISGTLGELFYRIAYIERKVYIDTDLTTNGTGSQDFPFNNFDDAKLFAEEKGIYVFSVHGEITLTSNFKNFTVFGIGLPKINTNGQDLTNSKFYQTKMSGDYIGDIIVQESTLLNNFTLNGYFDRCALDGDLVTKANATIILSHCFSYIAGLDRPTISMNAGTWTKLSVRGYSGGLTIYNCDHADDDVTVEIAQGSLTFDNSCTLGTMVARGVCKFVDNSSGAIVIDETLSPTTITNAVWADSNATELLNNVEFIKQIESGKWEIVNNQMIFYEDDNITEIMRFNLFNELGAPAEENVYKRVKV